MPINQNVSASDYTTYLKQKATVVNRKYTDVTPAGVLNSHLRASEISQTQTPNLTVLAQPTVKSPPAQTRNYYTARSTITW
jgi:hypothetical protein